MPGNVAPADPVDVFPTAHYSSFNIQLRLEDVINAYPDGSSQRAALALNPRHFFTLNFFVTPGQYTTIRTFFNAHQGLPFYFYNLLEALPGPPPDDPIGRYTVVFDSPWTEELRLGRTRIAFNLREVI